MEHPTIKEIIETHQFEEQEGAFGFMACQACGIAAHFDMDTKLPITLHRFPHKPCTGGPIEGPEAGKNPDGTHRIGYAYFLTKQAERSIPKALRSERFSEKEKRASLIYLGKAIVHANVAIEADMEIGDAEKRATARSPASIGKVAAYYHTIKHHVEQAVLNAESAMEIIGETPGTGFRHFRIVDASHVCDYCYEHQKYCECNTEMTPAKRESLLNSYYVTNGGHPKETNLRRLRTKRSISHNN